MKTLIYGALGAMLQVAAVLMFFNANALTDSPDYRVGYTLIVLTDIIGIVLLVLAIKTHRQENNRYKLATHWGRVLTILGLLFITGAILYILWLFFAFGNSNWTF